MAETSGPLPIEEARRLNPGPKYEFADPEEGYEYSVSRECEAMKFVDDTGTWYDIYLPPGTMKLACDHTIHKRWDELRKFPKYEGQKHNEENNVIMRWKKNPTSKEEEEGQVIKAADQSLFKTADGKIILHPNNKSRDKM